MQRVVWDIFLDDPGPDHFLGPVSQRANLDEVELAIPTDDGGDSSVGALIASNSAGPRMLALRRALQYRQFTIAAATIGIGLVEGAAVKSFVVDDGQFGPHQFDLDPILGSDLIPEREGFRELVAGIEIEDMRLGSDPGKHFENDHPFGAKGGRHRESLAIGGPSPFQNRLGLSRFEALADVSQFRQQLWGRDRRFADFANIGAGVHKAPRTDSIHPWQIAKNMLK